MVLELERDEFLGQQHNAARALALAMSGSLLPAVAAARPQHQSQDPAARLADLFASLPATAPIAIVLPNPSALGERVAQEIDRTSFGRELGEAIDRELRAILPQSSFRHLSRDLEALGITSEEPVLIAMSQDHKLGAVTFALTDRKGFDAALLGASSHAVRTLAFDGEPLTVVSPGSERPVACLARERTAYCQIGSGPDTDPLSFLREMAAPRESRPRGDEAQSTARRALGHLPQGAIAYVILRPRPVGESLANATVAHSRLSHRFNPTRERAIAERQAAATAALIREIAEEMTSAAFGVYADRDSLSFRAELGLSASGMDALRGLVGDVSRNARIASWSETPALARVLVRVAPKSLASMMVHLGVPVSTDDLDGTAAAIALGVDPEAPAAKRGGLLDPLALVSAVPGALAVGLTRHLAVPVRPSAEPGEAGGAVLLTTREIRVEEGVLFVSTGPGGGAAAHRRWSTVRATALGPREARNATAGPTFFELGLDLAAIAASLAAGRFDEATRHERWAFRRIGQALEPLARRYRTVTASAWLEREGPAMHLSIAAR